MKANKPVSYVVLICGLALLAASLLADQIGIGNLTGFGVRQLVGVIVGAALVASSLTLLRRVG